MSAATPIRLVRAGNAKSRRARSLRSVTEDFHDESLSMLLHNAACSKRNLVEQRTEHSPVNSCSSSVVEEKYVPLHPLPEKPEGEKRRTRIPDLVAPRPNAVGEDGQSMCSMGSMPSLASFNSESMRSKKSHVSGTSSMDASDDSFSSLVTADSSVCSFNHSVVSTKSVKSINKSPLKCARGSPFFAGDLSVRNKPVYPNSLIAGTTLDCIESITIKTKEAEVGKKRQQLDQHHIIILLDPTCTK